MKAHGIEFEHRRPANEPGVAQDYAEFSAFAALCAAAGVADLVDRVFYDSKWQGFNIEVSEALEFSLGAAVIQRCASQSLTRFILFGIYREKDGTPPLGPATDVDPDDSPF